jgi:hypothetical protein
MKKILKEPLFHFLLIGLLLYFTTAFIKQRQNPENVINIDNATVGRLVSRFIIQNGYAPGKEQIDALIENEIREEIQYREALRMGLDKDDEIIRRRLSQKMEFIKADLASVTEPSLDDLKQFYSTHPDLFRDSSTVSFTHIYLNADRNTAEQIMKRAVSILATLNQKKLTRGPELGDRFMLQYDYTDIDRLETQQLFGACQLSDTLFDMPLHKWIGPVKSGYGWHLVYLQQKKEGSVLPFAQVKNAVSDRCISYRQQLRNEKEWEKTKSKYAVNRTYLQSEDK